MTTKEFLDRERALARRFGLRKTDVYYQLVRCPSCEHEALLRNRYATRAYDDVADVEELMLQQVKREIRATCTKCQHEPLHGDGSRHVYLLYSERLDAHLAITLRLAREDDGRVRVTRQAWLVPVDGQAEEVADAEDARLVDVWLDSTLRRWSLDPDPARAAEALADLASEHAGDALVLRELGYSLVDAGQVAPALRALEASLDAEPSQKDVLVRLGRLYVGAGRPADGAERLVQAFDLGEDPALLPEVIHACYRGQRVGALAAASEALLELEPDHLVGLKGRVCVEDASNIGAWRDAWEDLRRAADASGERYTSRVAEAWMDALALPLPDWDAGMTAAAYRDAIADECEALGLELEREPDPLHWGEAVFEPDLEVLDERGTTWLLWLLEQDATAAGDQTLAAIMRAAAADPRRGPCRVLPLARTPLSYAVCRWASGSPDAAVDLDADADTTMQVIDENVAAFVQTMETTFGRTLDFSLRSLDDVDEVLRRYHDHGFGAMTYALRCQAAAYVGAVVRGIVGAGEWVEADPPADPRTFVVAEDGPQANLIRRVGRAVELGDEDGLGAFVRIVLRAAGIEVSA